MLTDAKNLTKSERIKTDSLIRNYLSFGAGKFNHDEQSTQLNYILKNAELFHECLT